MDAIDQLVKDCVCNFKDHDTYLSGYIDTQELYDSFWTQMRVLGTSFSVRNSHRNNANAKAEDGALMWQNLTKRETPIPNFGMPFLIEGSSTLQCSQGPKYFKPRKECPQLSDHASPKKRRIRLKSTKKLGCPAFFKVRSVKYFPDFTASSSTSRREKVKVVKKLYELLHSAPESVTSVKRFYIAISKAHTHSRESSSIIQELHPDLIKEIHRLVGIGFSSAPDIKLHLEQFVDRKFANGIKPDRMNAAFYSTREKISAHVRNATFKIKRLFIDQEALALQISHWEKEYPGDNFFFRAYKENGEGIDNAAADRAPTDSILFCYQAEWQKRLLQRYGHLCLLDATDKPTQYALPLFFLTVKTNCGYIVVGTFTIQSESCSLITEALRVFRDWNPEWQPDYWMTDFREAETNSIEQVFPSAKVYLCTFHREQAWLQWLRKSGNLTDSHDSEDVLRFWRKVANSRTEADFETNIQLWTNSSLAKRNVKAAKYFQNQWVPASRRWVEAFHQTDYIACVATNNGVESQKKDLKYTHVWHSSDNTLTAMLKSVINTFLPNSFKNYRLNNSNVKVYDSQVPPFLHNRPDAFIRHVMDRMEKARIEYVISDVAYLGEGKFAVNSKTDDAEDYVVEFNSGSCSCVDYSRWRFPCKHMCAVFEIVPNWGFDKLSAAYANNPYITLDTACGYETICGESPTSPAAIPSGDSDNSAHFENQIDESYQTAQQMLRYELEEFINQSYLCIDTNALAEATKRVKECRTSLVGNFGAVSGLSMAEAQARSSTTVMSRSYNTKETYKTLPLRRKKPKGNLKTTGQVGKSDKV